MHWRIVQGPGLDLACIIQQELVDRQHTRDLSHTWWFNRTQHIILGETKSDKYANESTLLTGQVFICSEKWGNDTLCTLLVNRLIEKNLLELNCFDSAKWHCQCATSIMVKVCNFFMGFYWFCWSDSWRTDISVSIWVLWVDEKKILSSDHAGTLTTFNDWSTQNVHRSFLLMEFKFNWTVIKE